MVEALRATVDRRRLIAGAAGLLAPAAALAQGRALTVFAAASLKDALDAIDAAFARSGRGRVVAAYAASSTLARQIEQGADADVFVSADADWMNYAEQRKLIRPGSRRDLASNRLALIAPRDSKLKLTPARGFPLAAALGRGRLAMAAPDVPAGRYGQAALQALGVWDAVKARTAYAENVRAALNFVARGEAPLGIVYETDARVEPGVRVVALFPEATHPRIVYPAAITARSDNPAASAYLAFLQGPEARAIFRRFGFTAP
jgi:molybdate transport system substrate-binding protein